MRKDDITTFFIFTKVHPNRAIKFLHDIHLEARSIRKEKFLLTIILYLITKKKI